MKGRIYIVAGENGWNNDTFFTSRRDAEVLLKRCRETTPTWRFWIEVYRPAAVEWVRGTA